ncbi:MAG: heme-binding domain-containing protein [Chloroflexaceae bacterium]|nr:heme-binding domain-containing protein [Chloroflexaceae bacterium]
MRSCGSGGVLGVWLLVSMPSWLMQTNPPVIAEPSWDSSQTRELAQRACFDCHSNETRWPLYSRFAPVSYFINGHVIEGRERLNFSEWGMRRRGMGSSPEVGASSQNVSESLAAILGLNPATAYANGDEREEEEDGEEEEREEEEQGERGELAEEIIEEMEEGKMPLPSYLSMHPEARLTSEEQQQLMDGFRATFR